MKDNLRCIIRSTENGLLAVTASLEWSKNNEKWASHFPTYYLTQDTEFKSFYELHLEDTWILCTESDASDGMNQRVTVTRTIRLKTTIRYESRILTSLAVSGLSVTFLFVYSAFQKS